MSLPAAQRKGVEHHSAEVGQGSHEQLALLARSLPGKDDPAHVYGFSCEDGCGAIVPLTLAEFEDGGAWADGHKTAALDGG